MANKFLKKRTLLASLVYDSEVADYPHAAIIALWHYEPGNAEQPVILTVTKECGVYVRRFAHKDACALFYTIGIRQETQKIIRELLGWYDGPVKACSSYVTESAVELLLPIEPSSTPIKLMAKQVEEIGYELLSKTEEVIMSPLRFTGVSQEAIKAVFEKYGIHLKSKF